MSDIQNKKTTTFIRSKWAEWVYVNLPFVCYLAFLAVIYIFNAHSSERSLRKMDAMKQEVKDYRWQYMNLKQELMYGSTQSQLTDNLKELELQPLATSPKKLKIKDKDK